MSCRKSSVLLVAAFLLSPLLAAEGWISLLHPKDLTGWKVEGQGDWKVEAGSIVARQGTGNMGGDIYTDRQWRDFELEAEYKLSYPGNGGIWFRHAEGQIGYHLDILDEPQYADAFAGSLYVVKKGFVARNSDPRTVHRGDWNRIHLRMVGDHITIAVNGKTVVDLHDSTFQKEGSLGLQVHRGESVKGMEFRVRKLRVRAVKE